VRASHAGTPVHVHERDRIELFVAGESAGRQLRVETVDCLVGHRLPAVLTATAQTIKSQALPGGTGGVRDRDDRAEMVAMQVVGCCRLRGANVDVRVPFG
jgi:hypothetical protein